MAGTDVFVLASTVFILEGHVGLSLEVFGLQNVLAAHGVFFPVADFAAGVGADFGDGLSVLLVSESAELASGSAISDIPNSCHVTYLRAFAVSHEHVGLA